MSVLSGCLVQTYTPTLTWYFYFMALHYLVATHDRLGKPAVPLRRHSYDSFIVPKP